MFLDGYLSALCRVADDDQETAGDNVVQSPTWEERRAMCREPPINTVLHMYVLLMRVGKSSCDAL